MLDALIRALLPNPTITEEQFFKATESELMKTVLTSQLTYFGITGVGITVLYKFFPKYYMKLHRYAECRQILGYGTPWHLLKSLTETAIEYGACVVGRKMIPWAADKFPSAGHAYVMWNSVWSTIFFGGSYFTHFAMVVEKPFVKQCLSDAPAAVMGGTMFSGNDIGTAVKPFYEHAVGTANRPFKRTALDFLITQSGRVACAALCGRTAVLVKGPWQRLGITTFWFIVDVFAIRAFAVPKLLDILTPYEVDGVKLELTEPPTEGAVRPFDDEDEETTARTELMGLTGEQMSHVSRFCWEIIISEHTRGSVKTAATKWLRYASLLADGTTNQGVTDLEDVGRVASIYEEGESNELEAHGVDEEHRTCSVCLVDFEKKDKIATIRKCKHTFHLSCVEQWWAQHNSCPVCRGELLREQSGEGDEGEEEGAQQQRDPQARNNNNNNNAGAEGQQQQQQQEQGDPIQDLYGRLFRMAMNEKAGQPEWEWGPLKHLFYTIGMEKGVGAVRELMVFDPDLTMQQSSLDLWHVVFVNLGFALPTWE